MLFSLQTRQAQDVAILPRRLLQSFGPVNASAANARLCAAALNLGQGQLHLPGQFLDQVEFAGAQALKVSLLQSLVIAGAHGGIKLQLVFFDFVRVVLFCLGRQGFLHA